MCDCINTDEEVVILSPYVFFSCFSFFLFLQGLIQRPIMSEDPTSQKHAPAQHGAEPHAAAEGAVHSHDANAPHGVDGAGESSDKSDEKASVNVSAV